MSSTYGILSQPEQEEVRLSQDSARLSEQFLHPLVLRRDQVFDTRVVRTLVPCCVAITRFRTHQQGLLPSELGPYLGGSPGQSRTATAGT